MYKILRDVDECAPASSGYTLSKRSLRVMRNTPFALAGYSFGSEELVDVFGREPWYEANPRVTAAAPPPLAPKDEDCVRRIRELEKMVE